MRTTAICWNILAPKEVEKCQIRSSIGFTLYDGKCQRSIQVSYVRFTNLLWYCHTLFLNYRNFPFTLRLLFLTNTIWYIYSCLATILSAYVHILIYLSHFGTWVKMYYTCSRHFELQTILPPLCILRSEIMWMWIISINTEAHIDLSHLIELASMIYV